MPSESFQQSDDASKYRRPFKRPCQNFFPGSGTSPPPYPRCGIRVPPPPLLDLVSNMASWKVSIYHSNVSASVLTFPIASCDKP